ncbi:MAG: hybrid sensor histidine kinase/response regulator [bacterium]
MKKVKPVWYKVDPKKINRQMVVSLGLLLFAILVIVIGSVILRFNQQTIKKQEQLMRTVATTTLVATKRVSFSGRYHIQLLLNDLIKKNQTLAYVLVNEQGVSLLASQDQKIQKEDIPRLTISDHGFRTIQIQGVEIREYNLSYKSGFGGSRKGTLQVGFNLESLQVTLRENWLVLVMLGVGVLLIGTILLNWIVHFFFKPVKKMALGMDALLGNTPLYLIFTDSTGCIVGCSEAFNSALGQVDILGEPIKYLIDQEVIKLHQPDKQLINSEKAFVGQECSVTMGREHKILLVSRFALGDKHNENGQLWCILMLDITERKHLEEQLIHMQRSEILGQLAGGIAHDFNNALTAIMGYAELLYLDMQDQPENKESLDEIMQASERAKGLAQGLLDYSRKQVLDKQEVALNNVIKRVSKMLQKLLGEHISLVIDLPAERLDVEADRGKLEQVLMNLATNARDAMPRGGQMEISLKSHLGYARIEVKDNGIGMSRDVKQKVFEPFFTTKGVGKGTGLGMSIVYGIVRQHNGTLTVESTPGEGTTFCLDLPLINSANPHEVTITKPEQHEEYAGNERVLVAEDEAAIAQFIKRVLEQLGYSVITCEDGQSAFEEFEKQPESFDLIITDAIMPRMHGGELYQAITDIRSDLPVLFISGHISQTLQDAGLDPAEVEILSKPFKRKALIEKVRAMLDAEKTLINA